MRRRRAMTLALVATAAIAGPAGAVDGGLYPSGSSIWSVSPQFSGETNGAQWTLRADPLRPAAVGNHFEMDWGCPVPGSEVAAVLFGALRTQAPSSLAVQVTGDRRVLWAEGDVRIPQSPQGGRAYDVRLPGGQCNVHLTLTQLEARDQHARGYFIDSPRILVRDLTAPGVAIGRLTAGWINASASGAEVAWSTADNFGSDGVGVQRVLVGGQTRWSGVPGVGSHGVGFSLDGIGDGAQTVEVRVDGDGTAAGAAAGTIQVDRTPPAARDLVASAPGAPGTVSFAWRAVDATSGPAASYVEINAAGDGSTAGAWVALPGRQGAGPHSITAAAGVADGSHAWRVRVTDGAGNPAVIPGPDRAIVDTTPPKLELHEVPAGWVNRAEIDMTATDNLQEALGLGTTEIDVNAAADGSEAGAWIRTQVNRAAAGRRIETVGLAGLQDGRHLLRIVLRNGGPFGATLTAERRATLKVDLTPPAISRATFSQTNAGPMTVSWVADDALAGVKRATVQWRSGQVWRTIASDEAKAGTGTMLVDVSSLPPGDQVMRVVVADAAGNVAARSDTGRIVSGGLGSTAPDPLARLRGARLAVSVERGRVQRRAGRATLVRRARSGVLVRITGRLVDRGGRAIVGAEIQARGHRGRLVGRALTGRDGRFTMEARPEAGGALRIGVPVGRMLLPARPSADVRLDVRPRVALTASSTLATSGEQVLFSGRIRPAPGAIGLGSRKGVVLEWLDPVRRTWRPVVNARIRRDGTFAIPWRFNLRGLSIPMRVTVPEEVGWPLLAARSRVVTVSLR